MIRYNPQLICLHDSVLIKKAKTITEIYHIDGLVQDCSISSVLAKANAQEILQSCTKPLNYVWFSAHFSIMLL